MRLTFLIGVVLAWLALPATAYAAAPKVFVVDLRAEGGIDEGLVRLLNEHMLTEFARTGRMSVIGSSDVKQLIEHEREKYVLGCTDDSCLLELGGALGADLLATASLGRLGDAAYLLNLKLMRVEDMKVLRRWTREVPGDEQKLTGALREGVEIITDLSGSSVVEREVSPWAWVTTGVGGAFLATGVVAHALNVSDHARLEDMRSGDPDRASLEKRVDLEGALAIGGYVVGGLALGAGLTWLLWPEPELEGEEQTEASRLRLAPVVSPGGFGIAGGW
jgi:hypothetical protein